MRRFPASFRLSVRSAKSGRIGAVETLRAGLFREAFRIYYAQQSREILEEIGEYANRRNPGYTETDVPRLIKEVRSVKPARRHIRTRQ